MRLSLVSATALSKRQLSNCSAVSGGLELGEDSTLPIDLTGVVAEEMGFSFDHVRNIKPPVGSGSCHFDCWWGVQEDGSP